MVAYNYEIIVGPTRRWLEVMGRLRLVRSHTWMFMGITNGDLHKRLVGYK